MQSMLAKLRPSSTFIVAVIAACVISASSAWAAIRVTSTNIVDGTVKSIDIKNGGVRSVDLNASARYRAGTWTNVASAGGAAFTGGWSDSPGYQPVSYRKDSNGYVYLRGSMANSGGDLAFSTTAFTLPAAYRPAADETFPVASTDGLGTASASDSMVDVHTSGQIVVFIDTDDRYVSLSGISFRAAS